MRALMLQTAPDTDAVAEALPDGLTVADWAAAAALVVGAVVLASMVRSLLRRTVGQRSRSGAQLISRVVSLFLVTAGVVYALETIGVQVSLLLGALGIGGIALAFAFQDILENFVAGIILQVKRPFRLGDIVAIGEQEHFGVVHAIDSRSVIIETFGRDRVVLPAAEVLRMPIVNWTANDARRLEVPIGIHYREDPARAKTVIEARVSCIDEVLAVPAPRVLLTGFGPSSVDMMIYVFYESDGDFLWVRHRIVEEAKRALAEAGIEIPFPQRVLTFSPDPDANVIDLRSREDAAVD